MTRSLTAQQSERTQRDARRPIPLVVITTPTGTIYLSDRALLYDYGNTGTVRQFWPFLLSIGDYVAAMTNVPAPDLPTIESLSITLTNGELEPGGTWLSEYLRANKIDFAKVVVSELDINLEPDYCDLTSLAGDEHIVWYRGELQSTGDINGTVIPLTFETVLPRFPKSVLSDATTNDARDLGKAKHIVYGAAPRVPLHATTAAARTTLAQATSLSPEIWAVTDTTGFTAGSASCAGEIVTFTVLSATQLTITARAQNGTVAAAHLQGTAVFEVLSSAKWTAAGHILDAISAVYALNPYNDEIFRLTSGTHYTANVNDGGEGTVAISSSQLIALLDAATQSALVTAQPSVTQQPVVSHPVTEEFSDESPTSGTGTGESAARDGNQTSFMTIDTFAAGNSSSAGFTFTNHGTVVQQKVSAYISCVGAGAGGSARLSVGSSTLDFNDGDFGIFALTTSQDDNTPAFSLLPNVGGDVTLLIYEVWRTVSVDADDPTLATAAAVGGASVAAAEVGFALDLFADLRGYEAVGSDYSVAAGVMLAHPSDILRHLIAVVAGLGMGAVEDSSFDTSVTNLPSAAFAGTVEDIADGDAGILGLLAFQARSNLIPVQTATAQQWRLLQAQSTYDFPAATLPTITEGEWSERWVDSDQISTRFLASYDRDPTLGDGIDAYRAVVRIDKDQNDVTVPSTAELTAAETDFERRELQPIELPNVSALAHAEDFLGYLAHESIRAPRSYVGKAVPWWDAYQLELGDIVNFEVDWRASAIKGRVVSYRKSFSTQFVELGLVEVE